MGDITPLADFARDKLKPKTLDLLSPMIISNTEIYHKLILHVFLEFINLEF